MPSRFVRPDTDKLTLRNGDWLLVKRRLNHGEQRRAFARLYLAGTDGRLRVNPIESGMGLVTAYLLDWSLTDDEGTPVVIRGVSDEELISKIDALHPDDFVEIKEAIEAHEQRMLEARAQEKKDPAGASTPSSTSPSPSAPAGASSGSASST